MKTALLPNGLITPTRKRRLAAILYESVLLFGVLFVADYLFDTLTQSKHGLMLRNERQIWLFLVIGAYFAWFWRHGGQTLAMKTWHLRLIQENGLPASWVQCMLRYLLCCMFTPTGLGFIYSCFDPNRQFPQDRLLNLNLVCTRRPLGEAPA
ncbi:MAG: RDD family protein [Limnobacter sp.]|nr:RDD family protein [Limnobacter sp.]